MEKKVVLIGAGAVGILCAGPMSLCDSVSLRIAASGERLTRLRENGLYWNDRKTDLNYVSPGEGGTADLVIIATKISGYDDALELAASFVNSRTVILPVLNGISAGEIAKRRFPENDVVTGFFLGHASVRKDNRITHDGAGCFYLGLTEPGDPSAVSFAAEILRISGVNCDIPNDMRHALWKKYVLNIGVNQATAHFRSSYGQLQTHPEQIEYCMKLMKEAVAIAVSLGISGADTMADEAMKTILSMPGNTATSMYQDVAAGRPTEVALFAGTLCALGDRLGISTPVNDEILAEFGAKNTF